MLLLNEMEKCYTAGIVFFPSFLLSICGAHKA